MTLHENTFAIYARGLGDLSNRFYIYYIRTYEYVLLLPISMFVHDKNFLRSAIIFAIFHVYPRPVPDNFHICFTIMRVEIITIIFFNLTYGSLNMSFNHKPWNWEEWNFKKLSNFTLRAIYMHVCHRYTKSVQF